MSKKNYRIDKTCLNCRHVVSEKFCPNCGQENTNTRKTFHHLFLHFLEDLTHYENAFWRTIKNLLFRPAALTKEYLSGKRLSYLAPVRLYIFISFVTFFIIAIFPNSENGAIIKKEGSQTTIGSKGNQISFTDNEVGDNSDESKKSTYTKATDREKDSIFKAEYARIEAALKVKEMKIEELKKSGIISIAEADKIKNALKKINSKDTDDFLHIGYKSIKELDSLQKYGSKEDKLGDLAYWFNKKLLIVRENNTTDEIIDKGQKSAFLNFPKVLIIYMPFFAFFLWLFHGKKRWYYFDHGIFTLHYFSFLLLAGLIVFLVNKVFYSFGNQEFLNLLLIIIKIVITVWTFYYFFPAHHRFYGETRWISFWKSVILFFINMFFILLMLTAFFFYTIINIH